MVRWGGGVPVEPELVRRAVEAALDDVDRAMSTWREDSELSVARSADGPVPVSEQTAQVVREALVVAEATGGAFDPTVQPLMELWGFHGVARTTWPMQREIDAAREQVGFGRVVLGRTEQGVPTLDTGGTALDLSAIAKGHGVDRVSHALARLGVGSAFVEVGGEVRAIGAGLNGPLWRAGVALPRVEAQPDDLALVVHFVNGAVATSGNYRSRRVLDGREVGHTMDARRGVPASTKVASATVLAPTCLQADALATALMVLDHPSGLRLIESLADVEAAWILEDDPNLALRLSPGLRLDASSGRSIQVVSRLVSVPDAPR